MAAAWDGATRGRPKRDRLPADVRRDQPPQARNPYCMRHDRLAIVRMPQKLCSKRLERVHLAGTSSERAKDGEHARSGCVEEDEAAIGRIVRDLGDANVNGAISGLRGQVAAPRTVQSVPTASTIGYHVFVLLSADVTGWLSRSLVRPVEERDLDRAYAFQHPLNAKRDLVRHLVDRRGRPLARKIYASLPLYGSMPAAGAVAYNATLYLRAGCRRQGFAKALYANETELYVRWGIREIHMRALGDGPAVWVKHFGFLPCEPEALAQAYADWAAARGLAPEAPSRPSDYPDPFLSEQEGLMLYRVLQ